VPENMESIAAEFIFEDEKSLDLFMNHPKHYEANELFKSYLADPPFMVLTHEIA
jgi:hypothetical protein